MIRAAGGEVEKATTFVAMQRDAIAKIFFIFMIGGSLRLRDVSEV